MTIRKSRDRRWRIFADIVTNLGDFGAKIVVDLGAEIVADLGDFEEDRDDCLGRRFGDNRGIFSVILGVRGFG